MPVSESMFNDKVKSCKELLLMQNTAITNILEKRAVYERLEEIVKSNPKLHVYNIFWDWYSNNYIDSQVMELTRIMDNDKDSKNLIQLVDSLIGGHDKDNTFFDRINKLFKSVSLPLFNINELESDRDDLNERASASSLKQYRDCKVAHHEPQKWGKLDLNLIKLNEHIDFLHEKILEYELKLNGSGYPDTGLVHQIHDDWESIFRIPWIE
jgi:hypothetical protein